MQRALDALPEWLNKWKMAVNAGKTTALLIGRHWRKPPPLTLLGQNIEWATEAKYLGVIIDRSLGMVPQINHATHMAKFARTTLRPMLTSERLPLATRVRMYKTYIRPLLTYAAPAWYALANTHQRARLQAQQNISLRVVTGAGRYVRNATLAADLEMQSVEEFVVRLARRMFDRADNGPHRHLHGFAPLLVRQAAHRGAFKHSSRALLLPSDDEGSALHQPRPLTPPYTDGESPPPRHLPPLSPLPPLPHHTPHTQQHTTGPPTTPEPPTPPHPPPDPPPPCPRPRLRILPAQQETVDDGQEWLDGLRDRLREMYKNIKK